jgi:hypothetical protein
MQKENHVEKSMKTERMARFEAILDKHVWLSCSIYEFMPNVGEFVKIFLKVC